MARLWVAFPTRNQSDDDRVVLVDTTWREVGTCEWVDEAVWDGAVSLCLRHHTWLPTIRQLLEACMEVSREQDRRDERAEATAAEAATTLRALDDGGTALPAFHRALASGTWDRAVARTTVRLQRRNAVHADAYRAEFGAQSLETPLRLRKERARTAAERAISQVPLRSVVTEQEVDDMLWRMSRTSSVMEGVWPLRGPLAAALAVRLDHDGEF